jgi:hypothetical protein
LLQRGHGRERERERKRKRRTERLLLLENIEKRVCDFLS